jgi:6,7-dimethyl-8-ribityllumazine synthase
MSSSHKNLSVFSDRNTDAKGMSFGIVVSEWNTEVTEALRSGAIETLKQLGAKEEDIFTEYVPGTFELPLGARFFADSTDVDAVICLGCVVQGETRHFDFICSAAAQGIMQVNLDYGVPVVFGVLTTDNQEQALDRAGGKHGNKGTEAAVTAVKMVSLSKKMND